MNGFGKLTLTELKLFLREPLAVFFTLVFPPLLFVILGSIPSLHEPQSGLGGLRLIDLYLPIVVALSIAMLALNALPQVLATYRERGMLRRMATTPMRPSRLLLAQLVVYLGISLATVVLLLAIGRFRFGVALPKQAAAFALSFLLSLLAMFAVGLLVAALAPSGRGANAIGSVLFFPMLFFAGLWLPRAGMPAVLRQISDFTPLGAGVQSLQNAAAGSWPQPLHLAVMMGWAVAAGLAAVKLFRWE
jgi:ABC-2 type transport system permease protein